MIFDCKMINMFSIYLAKLRIGKVDKEKLTDFIFAGNLNRSKHLAINKIGHGKCIYCDIDIMNIHTEILHFLLQE